ncbi:MAG: hypothetical protein GY839_03995 [candidate division Zixibacteria bacterium]|nr:hypothetical protein [candidate division Zixibacteria bacterium]
MYNLRFIFIGLLFGLYSYFMFNPAFLSGPNNDVTIQRDCMLSSTKPVDEKLGGGIKIHGDGNSQLNPNLSPYGPGDN